MGVILPMRRRAAGLGADLSLATSMLTQSIADAQEAAGPLASMAAQLAEPGSANPNNPNGTVTDPKKDLGVTGTKAEPAKTNWLGWGLVAAGLGGLVLVGMAARKKRRGRRA